MRLRGPRASRRRQSPRTQPDPPLRQTGSELMIRGGAATAIAIALSSTPAIAQPVQQYEISEQGLDAALKTFAAVSGREVIAPSEILIGKRSRPVYGTLSAEAALVRSEGRRVGKKWDSR